MIPYKYGEFEENQIQETKAKIRKKIFFLLLLVDPETSNQFKDVDVCQAFKNVQTLINGYNELLSYPREVVSTASLLEAALMEYHNPDFSYERYRKLLLDAGREVINIKGVS